MLTQSLARTLYPNSYWNETGIYQDQYSKLYDELVPSYGDASSVHGELLRMSTKLVHEFNNNGNINIEDSSSEFFEYLEYIVDTINNNEIIKISKELKIVMIDSSYNYNKFSKFFTEKNINLYNTLMDIVLEFILKQKFNK